MTDNEIEEQAEEYAKKLNCSKCPHYDKGTIPHVTCAQNEELKEHYKAGAKWGMEHAIEWHDLRENPNDLPEECENVLCFCYSAGVEYYSVGHFVKSDDLGLIWWSNSGSAKLFNVIAWCELPKFEE